MILGIGVDIVAVKRFDGLWARHGPRVLAHVLSTDEIVVAKGRKDVARFLAKRWAAKEAIVKAFGCGLRFPMLMPNMQVVPDSLGRPQARFLGPAESYVAERSALVHLSISDEQETVIAFAVVEKKPAGPMPGGL